MAIETQRRLLGDPVRNRAFAAALARAIRPGRTRVAELGAGTGFLAVLCARAGARAVWACECDAGLVRLAREVVAANGAAVEVALGHSTRLAPPWPADLVVAEVLGHIAVEEHIVESLRDARRWLAAGGRMIPRALTQWLCPVVASDLQDAIDIFRPGAGDLCGVELGPARRIALQNAYVRTVPAAALLEGGRAARALERLAFPGEHSSRRRMEAAWTLPRCTVHGLCLWWEAELWEGVRLSTSPLAPPTHWEQIYLPLLAPLEAEPGDRLHCELSLDTRWDSGCALRWRGRLERAGRAVARFVLDNRAGALPP